MKRRRSGSEQGMHAEVVRFFNLVSGASGSRSSSSNSAAADSFGDDSSSAGFSGSSGKRARRFWLDVAAPAVEARYGAVALEQEERDGLFEVRIRS
jgi:hypothetical protein